MSGETVEATTRHIGEEAEEPEAIEATTGRNIIVAIGINEYQCHPTLNNPINDAQAVLALFTQCGFEELPGVPSLVANDATRAEIADLPYRLAAELEPDDSLVVFFAGHGEKRETQASDAAQPGEPRPHRTGYLIPVDGPENKPGEWIKLDGWLDDLDGLPARHIFVILDACNSGIALADKFKTRGGEQPTAVSALRKLPSRRVMTSALHSEKAAEGGSGSGHSVFAEALIEAIQDRQADKDGDGFIKTWDLFSYVQDRVSERAKRLFNLPQTPDYGYLPGDRSGDLVIALREGAFNRLIEEGLRAMLRHDVRRLEELVTQLVAANPDYPTTLYLQFRLKFMQGEIPAAAQLVSHLRALNPPPGTLLLSQTELTQLSFELRFWEPLLSLPAGTPLIAIDMLTSREATELRSAPTMSCPVGPAYQIENGALAQFEVTNLSDAPLYLYFIAVIPTGRLEIGPFLDPAQVSESCLAPNLAGLGRTFTVSGLPGSVFQGRIFSSPCSIPELMSPPTSNVTTPLNLDDSTLCQMQRSAVWYQVPETEISTAIDVTTIVAAFTQ